MPSLQTSLPPELANNVVRLYRECLRIAKFIGKKQHNTELVVGMVRQQFKKHMNETDPEKIQKLKDDAARGLINHMLFESEKLAGRKMGDASFLDRMLLQLRSTCKYYSGYPKDLGPSQVIHFTSEREFVQLLHQGYPVVVAFTIRSNYTQHLDKMLEEAAAEFYPNIKFMRVECPKYPGFCITRQKSEYPFIEIFHSPQQAGNEGKVQDPNVTKYSVKVLPYNYDMSPYGFREFCKRQGVRTSDPK